MMSGSEGSAIVEFGRFRFAPHRRELLADGRPIEIGGRAFDALTALVEARGAVVSKDVLMRRIWPDRVVEENNLQAHISALRSALGADRWLIRTVAGRGYQFTGVIRVLSASPDERAGMGVAAAQPNSTFPPTNLPEPVSELIGRDTEIDEIFSLVGAHRLVTLTGVGGIGKTRLALAAARRLLPEFADGVRLAEFSPLSDPDLVPATVAAAVGLELSGGAVSARRVAQALAHRRLLLVLETCEHVIAAATVLAEAVLRAGSAVRIIATSREPLRAEGEQIYPVPPLTVPAAEDDDPWQYGAVRLFVERARARGAHVSRDRHVAGMIVAICRRLDGIPLAIELAAARAPALGVEELSARLDDRLRLLTGGRRTALPRHQTLRATLDWSYELLAEPERKTLRRLAIFAGSFSLEGAGGVVASPGVAPSDVVDDVSSLIAKSLLVAADVDDAIARYRLLDTMRAYALEKLAESGELGTVAHRHAEYYGRLFERAETEWELRTTAEWLADYGRQIDNLRAALDWAFSPGGDAAIGVALTAAAVPLWMHLSLMEECSGRVERALAAVAGGMARDARREMQLHAALTASLMYTKGAVSKIGALGTKALEIAESVGSIEYQLRSLWGLWTLHVSNGQHCVALTLAQRFYGLAGKGSDPIDSLIGERMIGGSKYYLGDLASARHHLERVLANDIAPTRKWQIVRFQVDQWAGARAYLARILWLQGLPEQAMRTAELSVADARATNHAMSLGNALAVAACPIALWVGDMAAAERYVEMLLEHSIGHALPRWRVFGRCYQGMLVIERGDVEAGLRLLRATLTEPGATGNTARLITFLISAASDRAGQIAGGLAEIEEAVVRSDPTEERWVIAELLRIRGELVLLRGAPGAVAAAEGHFRQALDWARRQGALSWELRAATSLARLRRDQARRKEARELLVPVYVQFREGFDTVDLKTARALIEEVA